MSDLFVPLDDHPAYRQIANLIEQRIVERTLRTGDALPSETDLARQFGVNRSTIREAIRELEVHGLLGRERGEKRLRVTRPEPRRVSSGVSRALALHDVTFMELWEAMMAIEPAAAQYAASRRTAAQLLGLTRASARFKREITDTAGAVAAVVRFFHRGRRRQRQSGIGPVAGAAQLAAGADADAAHRSRTAGARANSSGTKQNHRSHQAEKERTSPRMDGKAHSRFQARLRTQRPDRRFGAAQTVRALAEIFGQSFERGEVRPQAGLRQKFDSLAE